jgi:hypothetical protein
MSARATKIESHDKHWERLADEAERAAAWDRERGYDLSLPGQSPGDHRARLYRNTAKSIRLSDATGVPHCACHLVPNSQCAEIRRKLRQ